MGSLPMHQRNSMYFNEKQKIRIIRRWKCEGVPLRLLQETYKIGKSTLNEWFKLYKDQVYEGKTTSF